jgi:hypothetical protein
MIASDGSYPETYDIKNIKAYVDGNPIRESNNMLVIDYFDAVVKGMKKKGGGRPSAGVTQRLEEINKSLGKLRSSETMCKHLLQIIKDRDEVAAPEKKRRRISKKNSDEEPIPNNFVVQSTYKYTGMPCTRGRRYVVGFGAQSLSRRLQRVAFSHTMDIDQVNSVFVILDQLLDKLEVATVMPSEVRKVIKDCAVTREHVCRNILHVDMATGKQLLHAVLHGGNIKAPYESNEFLKTLQKASTYLRWLACSLLPDAYEYYCSQPDKKYPESTVLSHLCTIVEDNLMEAMTDFLRQQPVSHLSLHFDGIRLNCDYRTVADEPQDVEELMRRCEEHIAKQTGFEVQFKVKKHQYFSELIVWHAVSTMKVTVADIFKKRGNCIPLALAHLTGKHEAIETKLNDPNNRGNVYAAQRFCRSYSQALQLADLHLVPVPGFGIDSDGNYLLHTEGNGNPHCFGVRVENAKSTVIIWDGEQNYHMPWIAFTGAVSESIDASSFMTFKLYSNAEDCVWPSDADRADLQRLFELQAGGKQARSTVLKKPAAACKRPAATTACTSHHSDTDYNSDSSVESVHMDVPDPADEATVIVGDQLLSLLQHEVKQTSKLRSFNPSDRCPLCPWRRFPHRFDGASATRIRSHLDVYHKPNSQYCGSGTKQLKIVMALYDNDILMRQVPSNLLGRSAEIMRVTVQPGIQSNLTHIDKLVRLVQDGEGVKFVNADMATNHESVRRVGNLLYTHTFAELLFKEVLVHSCRLKSVITRIAIHVANAGSELANLLPTHPRYWWPMIEDVFNSPAVQAMRFVMLAELETNREYVSISIDATLRICLSIMGQNKQTKKTTKEHESAYSTPDSITRILSVRGRTGAVLAMVPMSNETAEEVATALSDSMSDTARQQVRFLFCDNASRKLYNTLASIFPLLETLALDPVHLPIVYEYATWRKRTPGSLFLRTIMAKFNKIDSTRNGSSWGDFYCGDPNTKLDRAEDIMRQKILDRFLVASNLIDKFMRSYSKVIC